MLQRLSLATALILYCVSFSYAQRGAGVAITNISAEPKNVYALIIGISNYKEVPKLEYTVNDAELIYNILNQKFPKSSGNIVKLIDAEANEVRIQRELKNIFSQASDGDLVVVYFAGHGDVANVIGEESGFFLTANASKSREYEFGGAISFELVMKYINGIASKNAKVWLITDACRSGKIINEAGAKGTLTALNSSFLNTTKFISCQGHELSYEYKEIKHGVFTYYLARGFSGEADIEEEDGNITVEELRRYLQKNVRKFTENLQSPKVSGSDDFEIIAISNQKLLAFLTSEYKPGTSNAFAGIGRNTGEGAEKSLVLKSFEEALYAGKLHTVENSAYSIWEKSKSSKETSQKEVTIMKDLLIEALVERGQNSINLFLSSHPSVGRKSDFETSVKDFKLAAKILGKDDDFYETLINRSQFFEALVIIQNKDYNNLNKAEELLVKLKEIEPNAAYTHQGLALLYMLKSQKNEAEKELLAASKKISTWEKPKNTNAYIKILSGRLEEASDIIKEVEMLTSGSTETSILKSKLFTAKLELKSAEAELKKLKELKVEDVDNEILLLLAQVEQLRGRIKKADDVYMSVLENDKNNIEALKGLAIMYRNDKDTAKAIQYFELAIKVAPNDNETAKRRKNRNFGRSCELLRLGRCKKNGHLICSKRKSR
jgi:tetratricopeptide (TPR) repeat protein